MDKARVLADLDAHSFSAPLWARSAHVQTVWATVFPQPYRVPDREELLATPDGDALHLHHYDGEIGRPTALLLHGLEGSHRASYIQGTVAQLLAIGWSVVAMEFRSCSGQMNSRLQLYHSGETGDIDHVARTLLARGSVNSLAVVGFSLGGNVVAKWLGEHGEDVPEGLVAGVSVCPPFDLTASAPCIDEVAGGFYIRRFLRTLVPKAEEKARQFPGVMDMDKVRACSSFQDFDTWATAPVHGFRDAEDYWARSGCGQFLDQVRRPHLLIAAADDPFNPGSTLPRKLAADSDFLIAQFPDHGGHIGFVYGPPWAPCHWAEEQIARFLAHFAD